MPTFGFSAFLKLLCLNDKPQQRQIRQRILPSMGGYDFHRSLRLLTRRLLLETDSLDHLLAQADGLANSAEARSARDGLERLSEWRETNPGPIINISPRVFESPTRAFKVQFAPDFGLAIGGTVTAIHIWNTARPALVPRMVYAALSLIPELYEDESTPPPDDFGVLSLPERRLYRLSDVGDHSIIGRRIVSLIEDKISQLSTDFEDPLGPTQEMPY